MNEERFQAFYEATARPLTAYLARLTGEIEAAPDLAQESYLRLLRTAPPALENAGLRAYLYRTATRLVYDGWRRRRRERDWRREAAPGAPAAGGAEADLDVRRMMGRLKPRERALLWLAYVEGRSHREIADILELRPASVRVLLYRARHRLARLLERGGVTGRKNA